MKVIKMLMIIIKFQEQFYHYKTSRPCTVGVINEYHVSIIPAGTQRRFRFKDNERFDEINQSKTDQFKIIATYTKIVIKDKYLFITVLL